MGPFAGILAATQLLRSALAPKGVTSLALAVMSARGMSLSWSVGHHTLAAQMEPKTEFQRILHILDSRETNQIQERW